MTDALLGWTCSPGVVDHAETRSRSSRSESDSPLSPLILHPHCVNEVEDGTLSAIMSGVLDDGDQTLRRRSFKENHGGFSIRLIRNRHERERAQLSFLALLLAAIRRSLLVCKSTARDISLEIGRPTNVRHVTHVTFDRFNGFLGLPIEFAVEIPRSVPSASASVFGVSAEFLHCSYDRRGNNVPTILLLIQDRLYREGGLQAEGIFRINAENASEQEVRQQLNNGVVPYGIDLHCLAGLIKAWFRELPKGVLDSLAPEEVMQCSSEEQCIALVKQIPPTESALLDWAVNLMADVAQEEAANKMNAHNIAMVFAPNMTQMVDPLTALMHAVQVMNLLKALILRTLWERHQAAFDPRPFFGCRESLFDDDSDEDTAGPCFLGYEYQETTNGEIIQENLVAPYNSPTSKCSPKDNNSENDLGEDFVFEFSDRSECENGSESVMSHDLASIMNLKTGKVENIDRGLYAFVYPDKPDDGKLRSKDNSVNITNERSVLVGQTGVVQRSKTRNRLQDRITGMQWQHWLLD